MSQKPLESVRVPEPDLVQPGAPDLDRRMMDEEQGVEIRLGLQQAPQPRELLGAELARRLAGSLGIEPDQLPACPEDVECRPPAGALARPRERAQDQFPVVVVPRHDPELREPLTELVTKRRVRRELLVVCRVSGDDEQVDVLGAGAKLSENLPESLPRVDAVPFLVPVREQMTVRQLHDRQSSGRGHVRLHRRRDA